MYCLSFLSNSASLGKMLFSLLTKSIFLQLVYSSVLSDTNRQVFSLNLSRRIIVHTGYATLINLGGKPRKTLQMPDCCENITFQDISNLLISCESLAPDNQVMMKTILPSRPKPASCWCSNETPRASISTAICTFLFEISSDFLSWITYWEKLTVLLRFVSWSSMFNVFDARAECPPTASP